MRSAATSNKKERIEFRVTAEEKRLFQRAQRLIGENSISSFILRILRDRSSEIIKENQDILVSEKDREVFFESIFADLAPNSVLAEAAEKYNKSKD